jgi:hypothetical protein
MSHEFVVEKVAASQSFTLKIYASGLGLTV